MAPNAVPKSPSNLTTKLKLKRKKSNKITQHILSQTGVCTEMLFLARTQKRVSHHSLEALYLRRMKINFCSVNGWNPPKYSCCVKLFREMEFLASRSRLLSCKMEKSLCVEPELKGRWLCKQILWSCKCAHMWIWPQWHHVLGGTRDTFESVTWTWDKFSVWPRSEKCQNVQFRETLWNCKTV